MSRPYIVTFHDWTTYRLVIEADSEEHALALAQAQSTGELWEKAEARDGGQENWEAVPMPQSMRPKGGGR